MTEPSTNTAWARRMSVITLFAEDLAASKHFYQTVLGLPIEFEDPVSAVFNIGGTLINVLHADAAVELVAPAPVGAANAAPRLVMTIPVDDVDAVCTALAAHGVTLLNGPMDRPWGIRTASFADPGGHIWEIAQ